jgi:serine/threonine protein kinase/Tfp pilus assembly protein PilF
MAVSADRNLLFGVIALQMDFISRDALIEAMQAWALDKHKPIGEILVERRTLTSDRRDCIEALIEKHLEAHGNNPRQSLAAISSITSVRDQLAEMPDAEVQASLAFLVPSTLGNYTPCTGPGNDVSVVAATRFRRLRPHARGGLGEVFVAIDAELNREVALKEIQDRHADQPESRARFLLEAEITGGLEHPGIVPVYGLGSYPDGRPFYAMRFIRGDSLQEAIQRFHAPQQPGHDPQARNLAFRQLLGRFVDVCQAVAYAHSRGVLHRDLKPGNVMLGKYGETLVVDWGLAKAVGQADAAPDSAATLPQPLRPALTGGLTPTMTGSALGTPAFMSPEQAAGRLDQLGPASDVYSLGATLYCLLTGRAPISGSDVQAALKRAQLGEFDPPRKLRPDVPRAVEAVCLKAMALRPADRYASPGALADDVERWLADEPVRAWPEPLAVKAGRWVRRHKPLVSGMAAALLVTAVALTAGAWWYHDEQNRLAADEALRQAELERRRAVAEAAIREALDQAEASHEGLHAILRKPGGVFDLLNQPDRWQAQTQATAAAIDRAQALLANAEQGAHAELAQRAERLQAAQGQDKLERLFAMRLDRIRMDRCTVVDGQFNDAAASRDYHRAFGELGLAVLDNDPADTALRLRAMAIHEQLVAALDNWAAVAVALKANDSAGLLLRIARLTAPDPAWGDRLRQLDVWHDLAALIALTRLAPADLSAPMRELVGRLLPADDPVTESWRRRSQARYPSDFWLNLDLGNALVKTRPQEAMGFFRVAIAVRPGSSAAYNNLGNVLRDQKQIDEAIATYEKARDLDPENAKTHYNLGNVRLDQKRYPEAAAAYRQAIELDRRFAKAHYNLGLALVEQQQLPAAVDAFEKAIAIKADYPEALHNLGTTLARQNRLTDAASMLERALALNSNDALTMHSLASVRTRQGKVPEAIGILRKAIDRDPKCAPAYNGLGVALAQQGQTAPALVAFNQARAIEPKFAWAHANAGSAYHRQGKRTEAMAAYQQAVQLDPTIAAAQLGLGMLLGEQNRLPEGIAALRIAIKLDPKLAQAHGALGTALLFTGRFAEAAASLKTAFDLMSPFDPSRALCRTRLLEAQKLDKLAQRIPRVLDGKESAAAEELVQMASMSHQYQQRYAIAARLYREAFKARPELAPPHRYHAALSAVVAAKLEENDQPTLREQARTWLQADLDGHSRQLADGTAAQVVEVEQRLTQWQADANLAGVRDGKSLAEFPDAERKAWQELWTSVAKLLNEAHGRFNETRMPGMLTAQQKSSVHEQTLVAGRTYVIELESSAFDAFLKLQDASGKLLDENDDIEPGVIQNARMIFTPPSDSGYRIIATSFEQAGIGPYTLRIREFKSSKP